MKNRLQTLYWTWIFYITYNLLNFKCMLEYLLRYDNIFAKCTLYIFTYLIQIIYRINPSIIIIEIPRILTTYILYMFYIHQANTKHRAHWVSVSTRVLRRITSGLVGFCWIHINISQMYKYMYIAIDECFVHICFE